MKRAAAVAHIGGTYARSRSRQGENDVREGVRRIPGLGQARLGRRGPLRGDVPALDQGPRRLLGRRGQAHRLVQALRQGPRHLVGFPSRRDQLVRGRRDQRRLQLRRSPPAQAGRPNRDHLGRRLAGRIEAHHLRRAARAGEQVRQRALLARRAQRRSGDDLHADDPRGRLRDARLRAPGRHSFGRLRRLLARRARRPHRGREIGHRRHRRRGPARRPQGAAEGQCRRGAEEGDRRQARPGRQAHRRRRRLDAGPRRLDARGARARLRPLPGRARQGRGPAVHPLHVGLDRRAQGRAAHHRRLSRLHGDDPPVRLRLPRGRRLLVHRRRRLGDRPQLHRLRPARQRRDDADVRGRAELSRASAASGRSSTNTRSTSSTPRRPRSAR